MDGEPSTPAVTAAPSGAPISPSEAPIARSAMSLSLPELAAQITELAGHLNAANYRWLTLIGEFDRREGWADGKLPSCAHWLNFQCGLNLGAARERVRVAHALQGLPRISSSMSRGDALAAVAESYLAGSDTPSSSADRHQVIVHVDAATQPSDPVPAASPPGARGRHPGRAPSRRRLAFLHPDGRHFEILRHTPSAPYQWAGCRRPRR